MKYTILCFLFTVAAFSQQLPKVTDLVSTPNSPEAEAFVNYGNVPVSYYVGRPNISVPIYTIEGKELSVPVSLTYDASGVKVQHIATSAGTGWNLNAGGMVTRMVNDLPDDLISGKPTRDIFNSGIVSFNDYLNSLRDPVHGFYLSFEYYEHQLQKILDFKNIKYDHDLGEVDLMPDTYNFYAPGLSGEIIIDPATGVAKSIDNPDIRAEYAKASNGSIVSWTLTAASGAKYYFQKPEETTTSYSSNEIEGTRVYNSAWHLTKIESPTKRDVFTFAFIDQGYWNQFQSYHNRQMSQTRLSACGVLNYNPSSSFNTYTVTGNKNDYKIKQPIPYTIAYNNKEVIRFNHSGQRLDLAGRNKLSDIYIKYGTDTLKRFKLNHSYFTDSSPTTEEDYRLRLDAIEIEGYYNLPTSAFVRPMIYSFDYYGNGQLPGRNALSIDYLGYNNGVNNSTLIPKYIDEYGRVFQGADRSANFNYVKNGLLKEIHYPTGGSTEFIFEKQSEVVTTTEPQQLSQGLVSVGGGTDPNANASDFSCDDGFWRLPHTSTVSFTVTDDEFANALNDFTYSVGTEGNYSQTGRVFFTAIYASATTKTFCQIKSMIDTGNSAIKYYSYAVPLHGDSFSKLLPAGNYKVFMMNSLLGKSFSLSRTFKRNVEVSHEISSIPVASKIIDKTNQGETYTREFEYLERTIQQKTQFYNIKSTIDNTVGTNCLEYETLERYSTNLYAKTPYEATYPKVKEMRVDSAGNTLGHTIYEFYDQEFYTANQVDPYPIAGPYVPKIGEPYIKTNPLNGKPKQVTHYDANGKVLKTESTLYDFEATQITSGTNLYGNEIFLDACQVAVPGEIDPLLKKLVYLFSTNSPYRACSSTGNFTTVGGWGIAKPESDENIRFHSFTTKLLENTTKDYVYNEVNQVDSIVKIQTYGYGPNHNMPIEVRTNSSEGDSLITKTLYPEDVFGATDLGNDILEPIELTAIEKLQSPSPADTTGQHRIATPVQVSVYRDSDNNGILDPNEQLSVQRTNYGIWNGNDVLPEFVQTLKGKYVLGTYELQDRIIYHEYDDKGNPLEVSKADGTSLVYVWGYNRQYPIAKVENAKYSQLSSQVTNLQNLSDADNDTTLGTIGNEGALRNALDNLRGSLPDALVTTFTYDPIIGVTSITDASGNVAYSVYDPFGRLKYIKNKDGEVLKEYRYNHKVAPIMANTSSSSQSVVRGATVTLTTSATGGTTNFRYDWTVTNGALNETYSNATGVLTLTTTANHTPSFTVTCKVLDLQTNEFVTTSTTINVTIPNALVVNGVYVSPSGTDKAVGAVVTYMVDVSGGSGSYQFQWSKANGAGTTIYTTNASSITKTILNEDCPSLTVKCVVTDLITNEVIPKKIVVNVNSGCQSN